MFLDYLLPGDSLSPPVRKCVTTSERHKLSMPNERMGTKEKRKRKNKKQRNDDPSGVERSAAEAVGHCARQCERW